MTIEGKNELVLSVGYIVIHHFCSVNQLNAAKICSMLYISFWFCFFSWSCCRKCSKYSTLEVERMFCPSWAWLCWWQGSVGLVGVTIRYRSPHVIPSLDLSASSNLISSCFERKYDVYSVLFVKTISSYFSPSGGYVLLNGPLWVCYLCKVA